MDDVLDTDVGYALYPAHTIVMRYSYIGLYSVSDVGRKRKKRRMGKSIV